MSKSVIEVISETLTQFCIQFGEQPTAIELPRRLYSRLKEEMATWAWQKRGMPNQGICPEPEDKDVILNLTMGPVRITKK